MVPNADEYLIGICLVDGFPKFYSAIKLSYVLVIVWRFSLNVAVKLLGFFTFCLIFLAHNKYHFIKWMSTGWIICLITCIIELCGFISGTTDSSSEKIRESLERQRKVSRKVPSWKRKYVKLSVLLFFVFFWACYLFYFCFHLFIIVVIVMIMMSIVSLLLFFLGYVDLSWQLMLRVCDEVYFSVPHSLFVSTQVALATFPHTCH